MKLGYRYRFYPTPAQADLLARTFGCVRYVYNWGLEARTAAYREHGEHIGYRETFAALSRDLKPANPWLREPSSVPLQQTLRQLDKAFTSFFAGRTQYPRFKTRSDKQSALFTRDAFRYEVTDAGPVLKLAKMDAPLKVKWSRVPPSHPSSVTVVRDRSGRYFVSLVCDAPRREAPPADRAAIGVDLGLAHFCTLSTGEKVENPRYLERDLKKLRRARKALSRKEKGSANREKARKRVAKIHARIADRRRDFLNKLSTRLIRENQAVCVEDLNIRGMLRNRRLARHVGQAGWGEFVRMLEYKAELHGRAVLKCGRFEPTSKRCSHCGHVREALPLGVREWACGECGAEHDRDANAAENILAAGLAVAASGDGVSPALATACEVTVCEGGSPIGGQAKDHGR